MSSVTRSWPGPWSRSKRVMNHADRPIRTRITVNLQEGWKAVGASAGRKSPRAEGRLG
jgi:hypothetical protein